MRKETLSEQCIHSRVAAMPKQKARPPRRLLPSGAPPTLDGGLFLAVSYSSRTGESVLLKTDRWEDRSDAPEAPLASARPGGTTRPAGAARLRADDPEEGDGRRPLPDE